MRAKEREGSETLKKVKANRCGTFVSRLRCCAELEAQDPGRGKKRRDRGIRETKKKKLHEVRGKLVKSPLGIAKVFMQ